MRAAVIRLLGLCSDGVRVTSCALSIGRSDISLRSGTRRATLWPTWSELHSLASRVWVEAMAWLQRGGPVFTSRTFAVGTALGLPSQWSQPGSALFRCT